MPEDGRPILTGLSNGVLKSTNAMPMKDLTSTNDAAFEIDRKLFNRAYIPRPNFLTMPMGMSIVQRRAPALQHGVIIDGPKTVLQKKWIGGNRDSSAITANRRKLTTGRIMNSPGPQSFTNVSDNTTRINALARVRGIGSRAPIKVSHKNVSTFNVFTR